MPIGQSIQLFDLTSLLEEYLNCGGISDHCTNGLQVEGGKVIKKAATAVSANLMTIEQACKERVDALIVHHGLFWKGDNYIIQGSLKKKLELLITNGISLLAYHLPLDAHREVGNNWKAASDLGWEKLSPFGLYNGREIGVKGSFSPMPVAAFMAELEAYYSHSATHVIGGKKEVTSAALVSGGAYKMLTDAAFAGVDCFITGNYDEPAWNIAKDEKINFFALGHSSTEKVGPKALAKYLEHTIDLPCQFIDIENPF